MLKQIAVRICISKLQINAFPHLSVCCHLQFWVCGNYHHHRCFNFVYTSMGQPGSHSLDSIPPPFPFLSQAAVCMPLAQRYLFTVTSQIYCIL